MRGKTEFDAYTKRFTEELKVSIKQHKNTEDTESGEKIHR